MGVVDTLTANLTMKERERRRKAGHLPYASNIILCIGARRDIVSSWRAKNNSLTIILDFQNIRSHLKIGLST